MAITTVISTKILDNQWYQKNYSQSALIKKQKEDDGWAYWGRCNRLGVFYFNALDLKNRLNNGWKAKFNIRYGDRFFDYGNTSADKTINKYTYADSYDLKVFANKENPVGGWYDWFSGQLKFVNTSILNGGRNRTVEDDADYTKICLFFGQFGALMTENYVWTQDALDSVGDVSLEIWQDAYEKHYEKYTYWLEKKDQIKAYEYQKTDISALELHYKKEIKHEVTTPTSYITEVENALKQKFSGYHVFTSDTTEDLDVKFTDINGIESTITATNITVIQVSSYEVRVDAVKVGDVVNVNDLFKTAKFNVKYTDDTVFDSTESEFDVTFSLLINGVLYTGETLEILPQHKNNLQVKVVARYGTKTPVSVTGNVQVDDVVDYPITWELTNNKTDFTYGDTFSYGNSAVLKTYNYNGDLITTLTGHNAIHAYVNKYNLTAYFNGEKATIENPVEVDIDGEQFISLKRGEIEVLKLGIFTTYPEPAFKITRLNQTWKVEESAGLNLKTTGEITKVEVVYRNNKKGMETYTTTVDVTSTVNWDRSVVSLQEAYISDVAKIRLSLQREYLIESRIEINLFANIPVELLVTEDTTLPYKTYWSYKGVLIDSGTNLEFNKPTNLSYALKYKDGTTKPVSTGIYFKNTKYSSVKLNEGDLLNKNFTNIAVCYDYSSLGDLVLYGNFNLHLEADYILSLTVRNINTLYYGNYLTKSNLEVKAKIGIGSNVRFERAIDYYQLSQSERILVAPTTLTVLVDEMTFNVTGADLSLTFNKPTFKDVEFIRNDIKLCYINQSTVVNLESANIVIHYTETDYIETIPFNTTYVSSFTAYKKIGDTPTAMPLDANKKFNESFGSEVIYKNCYFEVTFKGDLMSTDKTISNVFPFYLVKSVTISSLTIQNAKTEYSVGDTFLNDEDNTIVHIVTTETAFDIPLRYDYPLLIVNPARGTQFTTTSTSTNVTVTYSDDASISTQYTIGVKAKGYTSSSQTLTLAVVHIKNFPQKDRYKDIEVNVLGYLALIDINDTIVSNGERVVNVNEPYYYGYIANYFTSDYNARVVLFDDFIPESDGASNITVKYPSYVAGQADNINNCHFGILFGANNATNRLFVSGNKNIPNADFHSAELNVTNVDGEVETTNGDFSYFAWESIMYYGETDNKVIGYDIVSNDKLLVLKNKSDKEKTIYFRTPITLEAIDASGSTVKDIDGNALAQEEFALVKGNNSNAGINPKSIINFNGDTLFIDNHNELVGLDLTGIIGDSQRYANSKSIYIDRKLKEYDLSDSILYTNQNYLFLTIKDLGIFVTHYTTKSSDNGQYEWWLLDSRNPTCFIEIDNTIYFGNDKGCFYSFNNNKYEDEDKVFANGSACIFDYNNEKCFISSEIMSELDINKTYHFLSTEKPIYYKVARISNNKSITTEKVDLWVDNDNNRIEILNNDILLPENAEYLLNHIDNERYIDADTDIFKTYGDIYKIVLLDDPKYLVLKKLVNGEYISTNARELNNAILCRKVINCEMYELNKVDNSFKLKDDFGNITNILQYGLDLSNSFNGEIIEFKNVESHYITAPFTMGHLDYIKTIWSFTLTNDSKIPSELEVAYASNKMPNKKIKTMGSIAKEEIGLDLSDFSFKKADFDKGVVPRTYTTNRVLARQRFTCFCFRNYNDTNSVISAMTVSYSIPYKNFGGD